MDKAERTTILTANYFMSFLIIFKLISQYYEKRLL